MSALLRICAWLLAVVMVTLPVVAVLNGWIAGNRWPMRQLVVTGEFHQISDAQVRAAVLPLVKNGFFAVDLDQVRSKLSGLPWIQQVQARKRWPDRLEISLLEYKPLARWSQGRMLSENGVIFPAPSQQQLALPMFDGPDRRTIEMRAFFAVAKPLFLGSGLQISVVRLSARGSWDLTLSDGSEIEVGRGDPQVKLERFARMLPRIRSTDRRQLLRADLRYTNGFALSWRVQPTNPKENATQAKT